MPLFGAHMSIAGGLHKAVEAAVQHDMDSLQIFTASPQIWAVGDVDPVGKVRQTATKRRGTSLPVEDIRNFREALSRTRLTPTIAHDSYLINLASPDKALYRRSLEAFVVEMRRAEALGLTYLVMHPGAATDGDVDAGLARVARALDAVHRRCVGYRVMVLLETTAGQGSCLGHRFEHLARILELVKNPERVGVCVDTCHIFAAGYALCPRKEYLLTFREFDRLIGLDKLRAFHVNDSQKPLGSRVDRHAHIGQGFLGIEPFRCLVTDSRFRRLPMVLETPKEGPAGKDMDVVNLHALRELVG